MPVLTLPQGSFGYAIVSPAATGGFSENEAIDIAVDTYVLGSMNNLS